MALIKCSKCGKEISDKALKCIHCGNPLNSKIANNTVFTIPEVKINSNLVILYILSIIFSILLFLYIYELNSIVTLRSGNYTILKLVKWLLIERNNSPILYEAFKIITWVIIILPIILVGINKLLNKVIKIIYIFLDTIVIMYILFMMMLTNYGLLNINYLLLVLMIVITILVNIYSEKYFKNKTSNIKFKLKFRYDTLTKIERLKKLLDDNAITENEYNQIKKELLKKEYDLNDIDKM